MIEIRHTEDTRTAYDQIFEGTKIHQMDSFFIWIGSILNVTVGSFLLDIATGRGQMVEYAINRGANAFGFDFSFTACTLADKLNPHKILCADAMNLPFVDSSFDFVTNLGSLEHFQNMGLAIQETSRILKPKGKACFMVPNTFGLRWNVQYAWKYGDVDDDGQPLQRYGTRKQWTNLLESNGLNIIETLGYEHNRAYPKTRKDWLDYIKHPKRLISMLLVPHTIPVNAAGQFVFICSKK